jgi:putative hemin transport protein
MLDMNGEIQGEAVETKAQLVESIRAYFETDRSRLTMMAARHFHVPERTVVDALVGHWPIVRLREGVVRELVEALPGLGILRVFVRSRAAVMETVGTFGGLSETGPFLNVQTETLDLHLLPNEVASVYAVEKIGHDSENVTHSFQFFDREGDAGFKVFLWENFPNVPLDRVAAFQGLIERFAEA